VLLKTLKNRHIAGWIFYASAVLLAVFSFKMGRAYSGLIVGAILSILFSSDAIAYLRKVAASVSPVLIVGLMVVGFWLVDVDIRFVFLFSWIVGLMVVSLLLRPSWLSRFLSAPLVVWLGKRSYAMYLIQGFAIELLLKFFHPNTPAQEVAFAVAALIVASMGATLLHRFVEEPARKYGKQLVAYRNEKKLLRERLEVVI